MKKAKLFDDLQHYLKDLEEILPESEEEFIENKTIRYSVSMLMMNIVNTCLDLGSELINFKQLGYPETYRDIFNLLEQNKILSKSLANKMKDLVGLRNFLAHEYGTINLEILYEQAKETNTIEEFIAVMIKQFK